MITYISSAIKKLQRLKSIVVPRVNAGGFPYFFENFFDFEMWGNCISYLPWGTSCEMLRDACKKKCEKNFIFLKHPLSTLASCCQSAATCPLSTCHM